MAACGESPGCPASHCSADFPQEPRKLARIESLGSSTSRPALRRRSTCQERAKVHSASQRVSAALTALTTQTNVDPRPNRAAAARMPAWNTMPNPPATTMAALSEVMKMVNMLPPCRDGSLGTSVSMLITYGYLREAGDPLSRGGWGLQGPGS